MGGQFDSTWQWISWAVTVVLFLVFNHWREELRDCLFPLRIAQRGVRQLFDISTFTTGMLVLLYVWSVVMEWIYNYSPP